MPASGPLARVNKLMHDSLDDTPADAMMWMPSHATVADIGTKCRGDGFLLTLQDRESNDAADRHVKRGVEHHRVPFRIRMAVAAHDQLVADNAMWIARATVVANQQAVQPFRGTEASRERAAKAAAVKRKLKAEQKTSQVEKS